MVRWEVVRRSQNAAWPCAEQRYSRIFFSLGASAYSARTRRRFLVGGLDWMSAHHVNSSRRVVTSSRAWSSPQIVGHLPVFVLRVTGLSRTNFGTPSRS